MNKSSGEKNTEFSFPRSSRGLIGLASSKILRRRSVEISIASSCEMSALMYLIRTNATLCPQRISSSSLPARDRSSDAKLIASRILVLPCALSPRKIFIAASGRKCTSARLRQSLKKISVTFMASTVQRVLKVFLQVAVVTLYATKNTATQSSRCFLYVCIEFSFLVETRGIEPLTS